MATCRKLQTPPTSPQFNCVIILRALEKIHLRVFGFWDMKWWDIGKGAQVNFSGMPDNDEKNLIISKQWTTDQHPIFRIKRVLWIASGKSEILVRFGQEKCESRDNRATPGTNHPLNRAESKYLRFFGCNNSEWLDDDLCILLPWLSGVLKNEVVRKIQRPKGPI